MSFVYWLKSTKNVPYTRSHNFIGGACNCQEKYLCTPRFYKSCFVKKILRFLKERLLKKYHFYNNSNQQNMHILHNQNPCF